MLSARYTQKRQGVRAGGQAAVEFVLTFLAILFLIFWTFELIMLLYSYNVFADAAKEGVRYAIVHGAGNSASSGPASGTANDCTTNVAAVQNVVKAYAKTSFHDISGMTVTVCYLDGTNQSPNRVRVTASYPYIPYIRLGWAPPTIQAAAEGRIVY
ncbi:MAG: pilus assembly protein [Acidobacteriia bacterium]|nr:pilus assembly protein [Terriglobia bacterium]